jgi:hypothetical protein
MLETGTVFPSHAEAVLQVFVRFFHEYVAASAFCCKTAAEPHRITGRKVRRWLIRVIKIDSK